MYFGLSLRFSRSRSHPAGFFLSSQLPFSLAPGSYSTPPRFPSAPFKFALTLLTHSHVECRNPCSIFCPFLPLVTCVCTYWNRTYFHTRARSPRTYRSGGSLTTTNCHTSHQANLSPLSFPSLPLPPPQLFLCRNKLESKRYKIIIPYTCWGIQYSTLSPGQR